MMLQSYIRIYDDNGRPITVTNVSLAEALELVFDENDWVIRMKSGLHIFSHLIGDKSHDNNQIVNRIWKLLQSRKSKTLP